ncbi:MAG: c-type cytochrome [Solirubrobacterales bacterium]
MSQQPTNGSRPAHRGPARQGLRGTVRLAGLLVALILSVFLIAACGGDDDDDSADDTATTEAEAPADEGAEEEAGEEEAAGGTDGQVIFVETGCGSCHTLAAAQTSGMVGPVLDDTIPGQSVEEVTESIVDPDAIVVEDFFEGTMPPSYGDQLSPEQIDALATFIVDNAG